MSPTIVVALEGDQTGAYGAAESREPDGEDEVARRVETIQRSVSRAVAEYSFPEANGSAAASTEGRIGP